MIHQLRSEFFRLSRSLLLLGTIVVLIVADLFLSSRCDVNGTNMYSLPELCTMSQFSSYADSTRMAPETAIKFFQKRGQLESSDATDLIGVFRDVHPYQFRWVLASSRSVLIFPIVFALLFLARDFRSRSFYNALYSGASRGRVFDAKVIFLFVVVFLTSLAGICLLTGVYAGSVYSRLPAGYVWSRLLLHALMDCAMTAPMLLVVCLTRNMVLSGAIAVVWDVSLRFLRWLPITDTGLEIWEQGANVLPLLLWSLGLIAVSIIGSWLAFRKAKLS